MSGRVTVHPQYPGHEGPTHYPRHTAQPHGAMRSLHCQRKLLPGLPRLQHNRPGANI